MVQQQNRLPLLCTEATIGELKEAIRTRRPISGIRNRATHYGAHNDEIFAGYSLSHTDRGRLLFPGIEESAFGQISSTKLRQHGYLGIEGFYKALNRGILLLGVGGGLFDEHDNRGIKISCTQLVVDYLGLMDDKRNRKIYGNLINYINFEDGNGDNIIGCLNRIRETKNVQLEKEKKQLIENLGKEEQDALLVLQNGLLGPYLKKAFEIPKLYQEERQMMLALQTGSFAQKLKKGFEVAGDDEKKHGKVFAMAFAFYDFEIEQAKMFIEAEEKYDTEPKSTRDLKIPGKEHEFVLLEMQSDMLCMNKVVHNKWRDNRTKKLGVLFLHKSNGQFVLMQNQQYITPNDMREIVKILRNMVTRSKGNYREVSFADLARARQIDQVPEIYFDDSTGIISNGSKVDPDAPGLIGTHLSVENVIEAIQIGLDTSFFPKEIRKECCDNTKCIKTHCWMYFLAQSRCFNIRASEGKKNPLGTALINAGLTSTKS